MVDDYKLYLYKVIGTGDARSKYRYDITPIVGALSWQDNIDTLGTQLSFNTAYSDEKYMKDKDIVDVGDKLILANNGNEVFRGIVTDESIEGKTSRSYTAYDYMFYLNKSKPRPIQINDESVSGAISRVASKNKIGIYKIPTITTVIDTIYKDKTVAEIFKDMLDKATQELGIKYKVEMYQGKLYIAKYTDLIVTATYQMGTNTGSFDVTTAIGNISKSLSIQDMKNSIIVTSSEESNKSVYASAKDTDSIADIGVLQEVVSVDSKDLPQASNVANNKLKELNKISENTSIELLGDDAVKSGRILKIEEPITKLSGYYLVKDCTHNYDNHIHTMSLTIESWVI